MTYGIKAGLVDGTYGLVDGGGGPPPPSLGVDGFVANFPVNDAHIAIPDWGDGIQDFSMEAKIYLPDVITDREVVMGYWDDGADKFGFMIENDTLYGGFGGWFQDIGGVGKGLHHIKMTLSTQQTYSGILTLDGKTATAGWFERSLQSVTDIGRNQNGGGDYFKGYIFDVIMTDPFNGANSRTYPGKYSAEPTSPLEFEETENGAEGTLEDFPPGNEWIYVA